MDVVNLNLIKKSAVLLLSSFILLGCTEDGGSDNASEQPEAKNELLVAVFSNENTGWSGVVDTSPGGVGMLLINPGDEESPPQLYMSPDSERDGTIIKFGDIYSTFGDYKLVETNKKIEGRYIYQSSLILKELMSEKYDEGKDFVELNKVEATLPLTYLADNTYTDNNGNSISVSRDGSSFVGNYYGPFSGKLVDKEQYIELSDVEHPDIENTGTGYMFSLTSGDDVRLYYVLAFEDNSQILTYSGWFDFNL